MIYRNLKTFLGNLLSFSNQSEATETISSPMVVIPDSTSAILTRILASESVTPEMKEYADRIVNIYMPAIDASYKACAGVYNVTEARAGKSVEDVNAEIVGHIEECLIDIEHGAVFKDNLSNAFFLCLLDFENKIESREVC